MTQHAATETAMSAIPATPANEVERQAALLGYDVLDTPPESAYDDLTWLACHVCEAPVALVSLIDRRRQWFKSAIGMPPSESLPRDTSFCGHAILQPEALMEVPDATLDPRFVDNPLVTSQDGMRFYAGAPLVSPDGFALGTLCVLDTRPRQLSGAQRQALLALSRQVMTQLELRRLARQFEHQSTTDALTQIWNRRAFDRRFTEEWSRHARRGESMTLLMIDVDRFKAYNDELGHPAGDRALVEVAAVAGEALRSSDHLARYGGEEFVALLPSTGVNTAMAVAQRVRQSVERHPWKSRHVTVSIGLAAMIPRLSSDPQQLIDRADNALLEAKRHGRNRVEVFSGW